MGMDGGRGRGGRGGRGLGAQRSMTSRCASSAESGGRARTLEVGQPLHGEELLAPWAGEGQGEGEREWGWGFTAAAATVGPGDRFYGGPGEGGRPGAAAAVAGVALAPVAGAARGASAATARGTWYGLLSRVVDKPFMVCLTICLGFVLVMLPRAAPN